MNSSNSQQRKQDNYPLIKPTGQGAFGMVYQAKDKRTGQIVAIKKVFQDMRYKNRELSILKELNHPNVVYLHDYYYTSAGNSQDGEFLNVIMDYMPETLTKELRRYTKQKKRMPLLSIKLYSYQLIRALAYIHSIGICHRDLKPDNVLVDPSTHKLKICDFGSAKKLTRGEPNVSYISSRPYRAPELIFGATEYTTAIDLWSCGCVIAEMVLGREIFCGDSSLEQIVEIIKVLGTPNKEQILAMNPEYTEHRFPIIKQTQWEEVFKGKGMPPEFFDLIGKMLLYEPKKRIRPLYLLNHPFFDELKESDLYVENQNLPNLFDFNSQEMKIDRDFINENLVPDWVKK